MFKPTLKLTLEKTRTPKTTSTTVVEEPTTDYVALAEEATVRIGKKLLVGAVVVIVVCAVSSALSQIAVNTVDNLTTE